MRILNAICKIREGINTFTGTEKKIGEYILENKEEALGASAQELADKIDTSAAAIVRFSKKLGYKGFTSFKVELAKSEEEEKHLDFDEVIKASDSIESLVQKSKNLDISTIEQTFNLINMEALKGAINSLSYSKNIYLFGIGASGLVALDLQYKLARIKKRCFYQIDSNIQLASAVHIEKDDCVIGISYSGETKEVNLALKAAKESGAKTIAITKYLNNTLSKLADYTLYIPNEEKEIRLGAMSSRMAALSLTDLLYLGVVKEDHEEAVKHIVNTRNLINHIK